MWNIYKNSPLFFILTYKHPTSLTFLPLSDPQVMLIGSSFATTENVPLSLPLSLFTNLRSI